MPQWKQYSGTWPLQTQMQAVAAGTWTGLPELYAWGFNANGRLGTNNTTIYSSPVQVGSSGAWKTLSKGIYPSHSAAIKDNGTLWMWGKNEVGQLGQNNLIYRSSPVQVGALTNWSKVTTNSTQSTLAVKTDGTLWSWGSNGDGDLGLGDTVSRSSPVQVGSLSNWSDVIGMSGAALAIKTDGTLWSWGGGGDGRLGLNSQISRSSPTQIGANTNWSKLGVVATGGVVTKTDGTLWVWGDNAGGQLGTNNRTQYSSPVQVGALTNWSTPGYGFYVVGSTKTDGTLWMWGKNDYGMIGDNTTVSYRSSPTQVGALTNWLQVCSGYRQTYGLKTDGTLWSWGYNLFGELGQNNTISRSSPTQVGSGTTWLSVMAGNYFGMANKT